MSTTLVAPTSTQQVNDTLYVGEGYLHTIQNAVDFAVNAGGGFKVVIPPGYAGVDTIASVVNGAATVYIVDEREVQTQSYSWNGTGYVAAAVHEMGDVTIDGTLTAAAANVDGSPVRTMANTPTIDPADLAYLDQANVFTADQTMDNLEVTDTLDAAAANVDGSPVRTFANTQEGIGNMVFPPAGVGVSSGNSWQPSIDPTTIPNLTTSNFFKGSVVAEGATTSLPITQGALSIGVANNGTNPRMVMISSDAPADQKYSDLFVDANGTFRMRLYPDDKSAANDWLTVVRNAAAAASITFTGPVACSSTLTSTGDLTCNNLNVNGGDIVLVGGSQIIGNGPSMFIDPAHGGYIFLNAYGAGDSVRFGNGAGTEVAAVDNQGNLTANTITSVGAFSASTVSSTGALAADSIQVTNGILSDHAQVSSYVAVGPGSNGPAVAYGGGNIIVNAASAFGVLLNWSNGGTGVQFGSGNSVEVAKVDNAGNLTCNSVNIPCATNNLALYSDGASTFIDGGGGGRLFINNGRTGGLCQVNGDFTVTNGAKNFRMVHPLDDTKYLTHSCIEGPECAVFYRGEGVTVDGICEITLPDYFEAITMATDRSVLVTALFEDDAEEFGMVAASRVAAGKFRVRSALDSQKFFWEVKAVRSDISPLEVVMEIPAADQLIQDRQKAAADPAQPPATSKRRK
jgi:hypothetical protein